MRAVMVTIGVAGCVGGLRAVNVHEERAPVATPAGTSDPSSWIGPTGAVSWSPDPELVTRIALDVALTGADEATLECVAASDPEERHVATVVAGAQSLDGLLADTSYACELTVASTSLWTGELTSPPLPGAFAALALTVAGDGDLARGYVVANHWDALDGVHRAVVVDGDGRLRWYHTFEEPTEGSVAVSFAGDRFLAGGGRGLSPIGLELDGSPVFQLPPPPDGEEDHDEARRTDEGYVLRLSTAALPHPAAEGFAIEVTDPRTGEVVWSYDAADGVLAGDFADVELKQRDPFGADAALWVDDAAGPAVWVSLRSTSELARIDRGTKRVTARVGVGRGFRLEDPDGAPLPASAWFYGQHGPQLVGDRLFLMDNGDGRPGEPRSRAVEYRADLERQVLVEAWSWSEDGWFEPEGGSVTLRPSGHVVVASGHDAGDPSTGGAGRRAFVAEIDPTTNAVVRRLELVAPSASLYRAQLVPGCALFSNARYCPELSPLEPGAGGRAGR